MQTSHANPTHGGALMTTAIVPTPSTPIRETRRATTADEVMFGRLPWTSREHEFVTSGELAVAILRSGNFEDMSLKGMVDAMLRAVLGGPFLQDGMAASFLAALEPIVLVSAEAACRNKALEVYTEGDSYEDASLVFLLPDWDAEEESELTLPEDLLQQLRMGFLREGVSRFSGLENFRYRVVLPALVDRMQTGLGYERHIRSHLGCATRLHRILYDLAPFIYDSNFGQYYKRFTFNGLGKVLWELLERRYFTPLEIKAVSDESTIDETGDDGLESSELGELEQLMLLVTHSVARPDPISTEVFETTLATLIGCERSANDTTLWRHLHTAVEGKSARTLDSLNERELIAYRCRVTGEGIAPSEHRLMGAHWVEVSEAGREEVAKCTVSQQLHAGLRAMLIHEAARRLRGERRKYLKDIAIKAMELHEGEQSWTEAEMREQIAAQASVNAAIRNLHPVVTLDENHLGRGNRYQLSEFGVRVMTHFTELYN